MFKNMKEARSSHYWYGDVAREKSEAIQSVCKYIDTLAAQVNVDVGDWPLDQFGTELNKKHINKVFFSFAENTPKEEASGLIKITKKVCYEFDKYLKQRGAQRRIDERIKCAMRELSNHRSTIDDLERDLRRYQAQKDGFVSQDTHSQLYALCRDPFFSVPKQNPTTGISVVTAPITLTYANPKQAANIVVPMGQYEIQVLANSYGLYCRVWAYEDNPLASCHDGYWHPHVGSDGAVCFGNGQEQAERLGGSGDLVGYLSLVKRVLTEYNDGNPYAGLERFQQAWEDGEVSKNGYLPDEDEYGSDTRRLLRRSSDETRNRRGQLRRGLRRGRILNPVSVRFGLRLLELRGFPDTGERLRLQDIVNNLEPYEQVIVDSNEFDRYLRLYDQAVTQERRWSENLINNGFGIPPFVNQLSSVPPGLEAEPLVAPLNTMTYSVVPATTGDWATYGSGAVTTNYNISTSTYTMATVSEEVRQLIEELPNENQEQTQAQEEEEPDDTNEGYF